MAAAGVTTMDEDSVWMKFPVRERGLYREFHESITLHYLSREKDPQVAYYGWPDQLEGGYEPKVARAVMQGFILQGLEQWCDNVIVASDQIPEGGFISKAAWLGCATHLKEQFVERRK